MPELSISEDKARILAQLKCNLDNMPDDEDEVAALMPQMRAQSRSILESLRPSDFRPAELMALMSLIGPALSRTPVVRPKPVRRLLRSV